MHHLGTGLPPLYHRAAGRQERRSAIRGASRRGAPRADLFSVPIARWGRQTGRAGRTGNPRTGSVRAGIVDALSVVPFGLLGAGAGMNARDGGRFTARLPGCL